jgi:hypothetical protein
MRVDVSRVDVWAAGIEDKPGGLASKLDALAQADIDLKFVSARRMREKPGTAVVYVTNIQGVKQANAAKKAGFEKTKSLHEVRIATGNKPGFSAEVAMKIAEAGINVRGFAGASISNRAVFYLAFDSEADAEKVIKMFS